MPAYIVMSRLSTKDPEAMRRYAALAAKAPASSASIAASTKIGRWRVLEGRTPDTMAVIRFDSWDDALAWYDSPEYAAARQHRMPAGEFSAILIEHEDDKG